MNILQKAKVFASGMNMDLHPKYLKEDTYTYALNAVLHSSEGDVPALVSDYSTVLSVDGFPSGKVIIGSHTLVDGRVVLFLYDPKDTRPDHEIGIYDPKAEQYTTYAKGECLNFSDKHPVSAVSKKFSACEFLVYFTDNYNPYRVINIDRPDYQKIDPVTKAMDCASIRFTKEFAVPSATFRIVEGGRLEVGTYSFAVRYLDANMVPTLWSNFFSNQLITHSSETTFIPSQGSSAFEEDEEFYYPSTSKAIQITLSGVDTRFKYVQFGIIYKGSEAGTINKAFLTVPIPIPDSSLALTTLTYTYKGGDFESLVGLEDILNDFVNVDKVTTHTVSSSRLIIGNVSTHRYNWAAFQRHASAIKTEWAGYRDLNYKITSGFLDPYPDVAYLFLGNASDKGAYYNKSTFLRDEVYAFGIQYVFRDGSRSPVFHIPGRPMINNSDDSFGFNANITTSKDVWDSFSVPISDRNAFEDNTPRWKLYNTYTHYFADGPFGSSSHTPLQYHYYGLMGYYEVDRLYPMVPSCDDHPDGYFGRDWKGELLSGKKIRHHRMPDMPLESPYGDVMRIFPHFIMSQEYPHEDVIGHVYLMGDRTFERTVLDKGLFTNFNYLELAGKERHYFNTPSLHADLFASMYSISAVVHSGTWVEEHQDKVFSFISPRSLLHLPPTNGSLLKIESGYKNRRTELDDFDISGNLQAISERTGVIGSKKDDNVSLTSVRNFLLVPNNNIVTKRNLFGLRDIKLLEAASGDTGNTARMGSLVVENISPNSSIYALLLSEGFRGEDSSTLPSNYFYKHESGATNKLEDRLRFATFRFFKASIKAEVDVFTSLGNIRYKQISNGITKKQSGLPAFDLPQLGDTFINYLQIVDYFYLNNGGVLPEITDILPNALKFFVVTHVVSFFLESDINLALRLNSRKVGRSNLYLDNKVSHQGFLSENCREINSYMLHKIKGEEDSFFVEPQIYRANRSFDYLQHEKVFYSDLPTKCKVCESDLPNTVFWSNPSVPEQIIDTWIPIPFGNSANVPFSSDMLSVLESWQDSVLAFSPTSIAIANTTERVLTDVKSTIALGNPTFLSNFRLVNEGAVTRGGCSHFTHIIKTPSGPFWVDHLKRSVVTSPPQLVAVSDTGLKRFFQEQLPFAIEQQFKSLGETYPIVNTTFHPFGVGYALGFDPNYSRVLVTKKDFAISPLLIREFRVVETVDEVTDQFIYFVKESCEFYYTGSKQSKPLPPLFEDRSFTVSFSLLNNSWVSFHSYLPRHYFNDFRYLYSNDIYRHYADTHLNFYGQPHKMIVDFPVAHSASDFITFDSVRFSAHRSNKHFLTQTHAKRNAPIAGLVIYNDEQSSGYRTARYPEAPFILESNYHADFYEIDGLYRTASLRDLSVSPLVPIWTKSGLAPSIDKDVFTANIDYLKSPMEQVRLKDLYLGFRVYFDTHPDKLTFDHVVVNYYINPR